MRRLSGLVCVVLWLTMIGCSSDPHSVKDQANALKKASSTQEKIKAVSNLRKLGRKEAVPVLVGALGTSSSKVKAEIAVALADLKDPTAAPALAAALELPDQSREVSLANEKIARALGELGDLSVTPKLLELLNSTSSNYVRMEAISSLGRLGDPSAVPLLSSLALDENQEGPINKKAIGALAQIVSPDALPILIKGLFVERGSISLYPEASLGLFRLRAKAFAPVLALLQGQDKELAAWVKERKLPAAVLLAKAAQLEGDLRDPKAADTLIKLLKYRNEDEDYQMVIRTFAAESLGRMRYRSAIDPLVEELKNEGRDVVVTALIRIGDHAALQPLVACATDGVWREREACIQGVVGLGGKNEIKLFDNWAREESKRFLKECQAGAYGETDCDKEEARVVGERTKTLKAYQSALSTVASCANTACLEKALTKPDPAVRERAAYDLAKRGARESLPALFTAIHQPGKDSADQVARLAAILAVDWLVAVNPESRRQYSEEVSKLQAQIREESQSTLAAENTEELRRLVDVLERGRDAVVAQATDSKASESSASAPPIHEKSKKAKTKSKSKSSKKRKAHRE